MEGKSRKGQIKNNIMQQAEIYENIINAHNTAVLKLK